jgi:hypothetical protein
MSRATRSRIRKLVEMHRDVAYGTYDRPGPMIGANGKTVESEYPILPVSVMPQAATQLTSDVPPIDDESFEPVTAEELSRAVAALTKRLPDDVAPRLYQTVKRHIQKNYEPRMEKKLTTSKVTEATLRRMIRKILIEQQNISYDQRRAQQNISYDQRKAQQEIEKEEMFFKKHSLLIPGIPDQVREVSLQDLNDAYDVSKPGDPLLFFLSALQALKIVKIVQPSGILIQEYLPNDLKFYMTNDWKKFYVQDNQENLLELNGSLYEGPAFESKKATYKKLPKQTLTKELIKDLKNFHKSKNDIPSSEKTLEDIQQEKGFSSASAVNQFINRAVEKLKLTSLVYDGPMFHASKNALVIKVLDLIDQSPYYHNDPNAHNQLYRLIDNKSFNNIVLRQIYGKIAAKSASNNLRSILNDLLKFLENEGLIEPNKRVSDSNTISNLLPRYFVETQVTNMLIGKVNTNAIIERLPTTLEQKIFIKNISAIAYSIINIIENVVETQDLNINILGNKEHYSSWSGAIRKFENEQIKKIKNQYYESINEQIARLNIDDLVKTVDELYKLGESVEPEWNSFLSAINA